MTIHVEGVMIPLLAVYIAGGVVAFAVALTLHLMHLMTCLPISKFRLARCLGASVLTSLLFAIVAAVPTALVLLATVIVATFYPRPGAPGSRTAKSHIAG